MELLELLEGLAEATPAAIIKAGAKDRLQLRDEIYRRLVTQYEREATKVSRDLGGGKVELKAAWKQKELMQRARVMADAVTRTTRERLAAIEQLPRGERAAAKKTMLAYKADQLTDLIAGEAQFAARADMLAHSGIVDVNKAKVMYWRTTGTTPPRSPCPICSGLAAGNPYTVRQATTLGAKAHPNCKDGWSQNWDADPALLANTRRQVKDGEIKLWDGSARTPARGKATTKQAAMQPAAGGWRGRLTQQRRVIRQRTGEKV